MSKRLRSLIVTEREVENEETGLDLYMYGEQQTFASKRTIGAHIYTIVVVSNLPVFNSDSSETVQVTIDRSYSEIEKLHRSLSKLFPGTMIPDLPNKPIPILDTMAKAKERKSQLTHFFTFCAKTPKLAKSEPIFEFLGVSKVQENAFSEAIKEHPDSSKANNSDGTKVHDQKSFFQPSIEVTDGELFAEEKEDTDEQDDEIYPLKSASQSEDTPRRNAKNVKLFETAEINLANLYEYSSLSDWNWQLEGSQSPNVESEEEDIDDLIQKVEMANETRVARKTMLEQESTILNPDCGPATDTHEAAPLSIDQISQYLAENAHFSEEEDFGL